MKIGIVQWFWFDDKALVQKARAALEDLGVVELRTIFSWPDWRREGGPAWFDFLVDELTKVPNLRFLPCFCYTPHDFARPDARGRHKTSNPPRKSAAYTAFVEEMIERYGAHFDWVQLWNEPNWNPYWDWAMDPDGDFYASMALPAARAAHRAHKKVALGGTTPLDYAWFGRMAERGLLAETDAVGFHYAPSWTDMHRKWFPLETEIMTLRALLRGLGAPQEIWLDESGISTDSEDPREIAAQEKRQVAFFNELQELPTERLYWYSLFDKAPDLPTDDELNAGTHRDHTAYHFGMLRLDGSHKPLYDHWRTNPLTR